MNPPSEQGTSEARTFHHSLYPPERIAAERERIAGERAAQGRQTIVAEREPTISVCLPARECAASVATVVGKLVELCDAGAIDEVVVIDAASRDGTGELATRAGATVYQEAELLPEFGAVLGKGDAMWRSLSVLSSEVVCFLDADTERFSPHFATGLLGPLVCEPGIDFVKAFYRRPFQQNGITLPEGGGRVNHLMARPALARFYPELAGIRQPLAGEVAARRELLERVPFATGYGVETAMLIDVWREVGIERIAQVDLEEHHNPHQSLAALSAMAYTVLDTIARRLEQEGRLVQAARVDGTAEAVERPSTAPVERPPMSTVQRPSMESLRGT
jgi:glucosyl-3-phosphoglycerate synthase